MVAIDILRQLGQDEIEVLAGEREVSLVLRHDEVDADWRPLPAESVVVRVIGRRFGELGIFDAEHPPVVVTKGGHHVTCGAELAPYAEEARFLVEAIQELRPQAQVRR
jgi:hypothetical protein